MAIVLLYWREAYKSVYNKPYIGSKTSLNQSFPSIFVGPPLIVNAYTFALRAISTYRSGNRTTKARSP
jgi:hypothetical protein